MEDMSEKLLSGSFEDIMNDIMGGQFDVEKQTCSTEPPVLQLMTVESYAQQLIEWPILHHYICAHKVQFDPFLPENIASTNYERDDREDNIASDERLIEQFENGLENLSTYVYLCAGMKRSVSASSGISVETINSE